MSALLPGLLTGLAVLVALGLPAPPRGPLTRRAVPPRRRALGLPAVVPAVVPAGGLAAAAGWAVGGPVTALLLPAGAHLAKRWWTARQRSRAEEAERAGAAEALAVLGAELRAGRPAAAALEGAAEVAVGPLAAAPRAAAAGTLFGAEPGTALLAHAERSAVPELLRGLAACWRVCSGTGSSLALAVDRLAEAHAAEQAQRLTVEAELAGPRATAVLLALLPVAGIALAAGLGADPLRLLLRTPVGMACLVGGLGLDATGLWWTARLVAAARRPR